MCFKSILVEKLPHMDKYEAILNYLVVSTATTAVSAVTIAESDMVVSAQTVAVESAEVIVVVPELHEVKPKDASAHKINTFFIFSFFNSF